MIFSFLKKNFVKLSESQELLNTLLDKINSSGINSLDTKEINNLIKISKGEEIVDEPEYETFDSDDFFLELISSEEGIFVDRYSLGVKRINDNKVQLDNERINLIIEPNFENDIILFYINGDVTPKIWNLKFSPKGEYQTRLFYKKFLDKDLPKIIKKIID
jgi:hypothetical protein